MIIEGDVILFTAGFLLHHGILHPLPALVSLAAGVIIGDCLWYLLGTINTDHNRFLNWLGRSTDFAGKRVDAHVQERTLRTLFISKFIYGIHHFLLVRAGRLRVPARRIFRDDLLASLLWMAVVLSLGFLAGASLDKLRHRFHFIELSLLLAVLLYFLVVEVAGKFLKKKL